MVFGKKSSMKVCTLAMLVFMVCGASVEATTYYVDAQGGDDGNDGRLLTTPWSTLGKANSRVLPGDVVYIRAGTYSETIRPATSGTEGNYITYTRYASEEVTITGVYDGVDLRDRHYIIIDGLRIIDVRGHWIEMGSGSCSYNIIQNCYMDRALNWAGIALAGSDVHHCKILNNTIIGYDAPDDLIMVGYGAHHNVIEGNDFRYGAHDSININKGALRNIIRNNRVWNPWHTAVDIYNSSDHTLVEGNIILDAGVDHEDIPPGPTSDGNRQMSRDKHRRYHNGIKIDSADGIIRNNVLVNNGMMAVDHYLGTGALRNRIYNNTLYKNYDGLYSESGDVVDENVIKNNIISTSVEYDISSYISLTEGENDNYYFYNNITGALLRFNYLGGTKELSYFQLTYPVFFQGNREQDPLFISPGNVNTTNNRDLDPQWLHLSATSPLINAGAFLTTTTSSGSGVTLSVNDASYFYDGWGIPGEQGDLIQLQGQAQTARITSIDYDNNRITVDRTLRWNVGQGVSLPYHGSAPDIGAFEYTGSPGSTYTLTTIATNGTINGQPGTIETVYTAGEDVGLQATPNTGYAFTGWSGDLSGTSNPTTITMDSDKSITAGFAPVSSPTTYTLTTIATNGTINGQSGTTETEYEAGESVEISATAADGFEFTGWSGSLSGTSNPTTITMDSDKSITASFSVISPTTYTLTTNATNGTIAKAPSLPEYEAGEDVDLEAIPNPGYVFTGWSGSLSGTTNPATITMDSDKSVTATFVEQAAEDETPPRALASRPEADAVQVPLNSLIVLQVLDDGDGVDAATVRIAIDGVLVYDGDSESYDSDLGICRRKGTPADYTYTYDASEKFDRDETITVSVNAADLNGNVMDEYVYSFTTEMWTFGANMSISAEPIGAGSLSAVSQEADMGHPATTRDSQGNIWVVWHGGTPGQRDIYFSVLPFGDRSFTYPVQLTSQTSDQRNPAIAVGPDDRLYVVWQDNRQGNWDVYFSTSPDGVNWSAAIRLTESDDNQTAPAIAVDDESQCYVAYEDDEAGHQDIYVVGSNNRFVSQTTSQITSEASDQTDPAIAVDGSGTVYCLWTDARNGTEDIYGAASSAAWSNVAVVTGAGNQVAPALATEVVGTTLHLVWADDLAGHSDIYYAWSDGLPSGGLAGTNLVDDTGQADQVAPAIAVAGSTGDQLRVYVCWQDWRNATADGEDTDLYFVQVKDGDETNVLVGDGGTRSNQGQPAIGADRYGYPYIVWGDDRDADTAAYYAGATYWSPDVLDEREVIASEGGTVGITPAVDVGDVSVVIPAGASPHDATVSIAEVENPQAAPPSETISYEFGPSGLEFAEPVTIVIPYSVAEFGNEGMVPCWYDSLTDSLSQSGITDIEDIALSTTLRAVRFKTSHFTSFYLVSSTVVDSGGSGGGGCSLSPTGHGSMAEFFLPYTVLAVVMLVLRRRDRKARRARMDFRTPA